MHCYNDEQFRKIGTIEYHDTQTSILACLAAFLRLHGLPVRLDHIIDLAPIPHAGADPTTIAFLCKRLGVTLTSLQAQAKWREHNTLLVQTAAGYWFLLWPIDAQSFLAGLPGLAGSFRRLSADSEIVGTIAHVFSLQKSSRDFAPPRLNRQPKLWVIPWHPAYAGSYDWSAVEVLRAAFLAARINELSPVGLETITAAALRQSHTSLSAQKSKLYGTFRKVNLRRGSTLFVDHAAIESATEDLLFRTRQHRASDIEDAIDFAAKLFSDFLAIHPFPNGNRRMAILLVARYLLPWKVDIDWSRINGSQHNYWMRCTQAGHFSVLREGFKRHLTPLAEITKN